MVYSNNACKYQIEQGVVYKASTSFESLPERQQQNLTIIHSSRNVLKFLLPIECIVAVVSFVTVNQLFILLNFKRHSSNQDGESKPASQSETISRGWYVCYCSILLGTATVWLALTVTSVVSVRDSDPVTRDSNTFLCDFKAST